MTTHPDSPTRYPIRPVDLVLRVSTRWADGDRTLEYRLHSPSGAVRRLSRKTHRSQPLGAPEAFHRDLLDELEKLRTGRGVHGSALVGDEVHDALADIGRWLYRRLFPKSLRQAYRHFRDQARTLLVVSDEPWIPWEIVKPFEDRDDDFFCMQFAMGRWLAEAGAPVAVKGIQRLVCVTVGPPEDPSPPEEEAPRPQAVTEPVIFEELAADRPTVDYVPVQDPTAGDLTERLLAGLDLLHFAGHGQHRETSKDGDGAWRPELAQIELDDRPFLARELEGDVALRLRQDRPVVFFNSCEGGRLGTALTGLGGWAQSWLVSCGASAFLSPFLAVNDATARELAAVFYREIGQGRTVGNALLTARHEIRDAKTKDDVAWLAYSLHGDPNLRVELGEDVVVLSSSAVDSPLRLPALEWRPDRSPPGALLRADYGVVPFHFRRTEIDDLEDWCRGGATLGIRLYTGAGGMGKTRLAFEICRRMRAAGWQAGLVDHERPADETWRELVEIGGPRLLIVDYAETRRPLLVPLLREIYETDDDAPIRVLLLARAALDWWEQLKAEGDGVGELLSGPATRWHTLQPLAFSTEDRAESYRIAAAAFAGQLAKGVPGELPGDLDADHYKRALLLHMSALAAIEGVEVKGEDGILDFVLQRERRFWKSHAVELELPKEVATGIGRAMAAITLGGGVEGEEQAILALRGLAFFKDEKASVLTGVARLLREIYPGDSRWIEPVMPDLLGEHLIMREMEVDSDELLDLVLGPADPAEAGPRRSEESASPL